jgi:hypothetical protein
MSDPAPGRARLGLQGVNARFREPAKDLPFTERHRGVLITLLAALFAALALWAVRLLRGPPGGGSGGA